MYRVQCIQYSVYRYDRRRPQETLSFRDRFFHFSSKKMMAAPEQQRSESVVDQHSLLDDSNSNESLASRMSSSQVSSNSQRSHSSVDIEAEGSGDEGVAAPARGSLIVSNPAVSSALPPIMSVADSLSPVKPHHIGHHHSLHLQNQQTQGSSSPPPPTSSTSSAIVTASHGHAVSKLALSHHHASHLYTIEAILGLNNQHPKGMFSYNSFLS